MEVRETELPELYNAELHALYSSPNIIRNLKLRRLRWVERVACLEIPRNAYQILLGSPEGKRRLGRPRHRWEDNIKIDLKEVGYARNRMDLTPRWDPMAG